MSETYRGGSLPPNMDPRVRKTLEDHDRLLTRGIPKADINIHVTQGSVSPARPPNVLYTVSNLGGNINFLQPSPAGSVVIWRFTNSPTLVSNTGNLRLQGNFTPSDVYATLTLISDGTTWYELSRSRSTSIWGCPTQITQSAVTCNPIVRVYGYDGADLWNLYYDDTAFGAGAEAVTQALNLLPVSDPSTGRGLYYNGTTDNPWREVWADGFHARYVSLDYGDITLSTAVYTALNLTTLAGGQFQIYRATATIPVAIQGIIAPTTGQLFDLINVGSNNIALYHQNVGATAVDRIITGESGTTLLIAPNDTLRLWYDGASDRWRVLK